MALPAPYTPSAELINTVYPETMTQSRTPRSGENCLVYALYVNTGRNDVNTVVMFFSVRTKKLPFRLLQVRWLEAAGFAGLGIHAPTMVEPKRGGSAS